MKLHNGRLNGLKNVIHSKKNDEQFNYLGRWVDKSSFRAFVYNSKGESVLAESYEQFTKLTNSGIWHPTQPASKERKHKHDTIRTDSE